MKHKMGAAPDTYMEFIKDHAKRSVRIHLSNGDRREGILLVYSDYVAFEEQLGGFAMGHIVGLVPLWNEPPESPTHKTPRHPKAGRS